MTEDTKKIIEDTAEAAANKVAEQIEPLRKDIGELGVLVEDVQSGVKHIAEVVDTHTQQLERLEGLPSAVDHIKDDVEVIKVTLDVMKNDLKQKVDRDEFAALEQRVNRLEAKF